jgi:hypothetical protein
MPARINLITLGVDDVAASTAFYKKLGFVKSASQSNPEISFFKAGGVVLAVWSRTSLNEDAGNPENWTGLGGVALAQNFDCEAAVDAFVELAGKSGGKILKPAARTFWGGYSGCFADPDGHVWEVAHNPFFPMNEKGIVELPE